MLSVKIKKNNLYNRKTKALYMLFLNFELFSGQTKKLHLVVKHRKTRSTSNLVLT